MIRDNLLYYIAVAYNCVLSQYKCTLEYLEGLTERVNKVIVGESVEWFLDGSGQFCLRKGDIAPVNLPFAVGYLYNPITCQFLHINGGAARNEEYKKFEYIGGELKFMDSRYDITDWLNMQRWCGGAVPSGKCIALAWLIKNGLLGLMTYAEWANAELNLVDSCGDDVVVKLMGA